MKKTLGPAPGFADHPDKTMEILPSPKRVRAALGGETVVDSTDALIVRESGHVPVYYFPARDIRLDLAERTEHSTYCPFKGEASYWSLRAGGATAENALWAYEKPYDEAARLRDHAAFYWDRMESWWEEDEEVFVHARDPKTRIDIVLSHRPVEVRWGDLVLAASRNSRFLFETGLPVRYYLPREDVRMDLLSPSDSRTACPYKGEAGYFHAAGAGETLEDIAWVYRDPRPESLPVKDMICFYHEKGAQVRVDGVAVEA